MDEQQIQELIASGKVLTVAELREAGWIPSDLVEQFATLDDATECGKLVSTGQSSYSIQFLPVTAEQVALMNKRIDWFRRENPSQGYYNAIRDDGALPLDGYLTMKKYFDSQNVPGEFQELTE